MQHLRVFVVDAADAVAAVFTDDGEVVGLGVALDGMPDIAQPGARLDGANAAPHGFMAGGSQAAGQHGGTADEVHAAGVAVKTVANDGHVDIDDVAAFQPLVAGDAVTHHVIHRGADGFGKTPVIDVGRNRLQLVHDEVVAALVQLLGGRTGQNEGFDHIQHAGGETAGNAHFVLFGEVFDGHGHRRQALFLTDVHGIKRGYF